MHLLLQLVVSLLFYWIIHTIIAKYQSWSTGHKSSSLIQDVISITIAVVMTLLLHHSMKDKLQQNRLAFTMTYHDTVTQTGNLPTAYCTLTGGQSQVSFSLMYMRGHLEKMGFHMASPHNLDEERAILAESESRTGCREPSMPIHYLDKKDSAAHLLCAFGRVDDFVTETLTAGMIGAAVVWDMRTTWPGRVRVINTTLCDAPLAMEMSTFPVLSMKYHRGPAFRVFYPHLARHEVAQHMPKGETIEHQEIGRSLDAQGMPMETVITCPEKGDADAWVRGRKASIASLGIGGGMDAQGMPMESTIEPQEIGSGVDSAVSEVGKSDQVVEALMQQPMCMLSDLDTDDSVMGYGMCRAPRLV